MHIHTHITFMKLHCAVKQRNVAIMQLILTCKLLCFCLFLLNLHNEMLTQATPNINIFNNNNSSYNMVIINNHPSHLCKLCGTIFDTLSL